MLCASHERGFNALIGASAWRRIGLIVPRSKEFSPSLGPIAQPRYGAQFPGLAFHRKPSAGGQFRSLTRTLAPHVLEERRRCRSGSVQGDSEAGHLRENAKPDAALRRVATARSVDLACSAERHHDAARPPSAVRWLASTCSGSAPRLWTRAVSAFRIGGHLLVFLGDA
jgi:hypothetical protein